MRQVCQKCALDDAVSWVPLGPGIFEYTCTNSRRHRDGMPHVWQGSAYETLTASPEAEGPAAELGMLDDLPQCVSPGEGWVEYGIVEDRYAKLNPQAFEALRQQYGHRVLGPVVNPRHTASVYIARVLAMLRDREILAMNYGKATGEWSYNGTISYWAKPPPGPPKSQKLTYAEYKTSHQA